LTEQSVASFKRRRALKTLAVRAVVIPLGVVLVSLLASAAIRAADVGLYDRILRWQAARQPAVDSSYVLVEIDDRSIEAIGRFPWSRSRFAALFDRTRVGGARVVGVDVIFAEPADPDGDSAMAESLRRAGNVVLAAVPILGGTGGDDQPGPLGRLHAAEAVIEPIPELGGAAAGVGSISIIEDPDGSLRRYSLMVRHAGAPYPSLAQLMTAIAKGDAATLPVSGDGTMLINYGSLSPSAIARVSFSDVLEMTPVDLRAVFENRIVMVAATYTGGIDVGPTPLDPRTPASFTHVYAVNTLMTGRTLRQMPGIVSIVLAVITVALLSTQLTGRHSKEMLALGSLLVVVVVVGSIALFVFARIVVGPTLPVLSTGVFVIGYGLQEWRVANTALRRRNQELQETLENLRRTRSAKERMEAELNVAREIQTSMLPLDFPDTDEIRLHATLVPAREVGGDFYDFFFLDDSHLYVCVGDVSGKGVPAALFMAVSKALLKYGAGRELSPAAIMTRANGELAQNNDASMFVTVWLAILDLRTGELRFTNGGHNPPYVRKAGGDMVRLKERHGPVVAAVEGVDYREGRTKLETGDVLLLYTDGVPEAMNPDKEQYEEARFVERVRGCSATSVKGLVDWVADDLWRFQDSAPQADDVTIVALEYLGSSQGRS
jgi:serine phosphatase RsbU (regulator of sigma subunit)